MPSEPLLGAPAPEYTYTSAPILERDSGAAGSSSSSSYFSFHFPYDSGLVAGVFLSNHGGRQLDFARSEIEVLVEVVAKLKEKRGLTFPNEKFQLFVDGGVRRATDVLKAIALGATAVGVGRPFLYSFSAYGTEGVEKAFQILHDKFEMNLRLLGAHTLKDIVPEMVDASNLQSYIVVPRDDLYSNNYDSMKYAKLKGRL
ncbi:FMN-dependent dehydrogenase-domain-containing protein [Mycena albidolilacea]|uniref:FMN-dependent dehydrogenase-domain-containing protein n=1 Tax=Mycena albidolilacea TaxID=1033008 RepID=A0AAD7F729_9AGAR|nr:FMN-dependent dehydrogenase-domain-containing protein [Mycena albidolilacea]